MVSLQALLYPPLTLPQSSLSLGASKNSETVRENLKAFGICYAGKLESSAIGRMQDALKEDAWLYPNSKLDYTNLIDFRKLGIAESKLQNIQTYFPPLRIPALEFCQFVERRFGVAPVITGSTVGYALVGRKNHDLDFKIFLQREDFLDSRNFDDLDEMIIGYCCDFILEKLEIMGVPLNFKAYELRELIKSAYLYKRHLVTRESEKNCDAIFINIGHDFLFIMNPDYRGFLATYERFLISLDQPAIYYLSQQKSSLTEAEFQKSLESDIQKATEDLRSGRFIVEKPRNSKDLFVRLIHASLKGMTIESPSTIIPDALALLQSEYTMNTSLFIKRLHTLLEKFSKTHEPIEILLTIFSILQHIKEPKLRNYWCWIAAQALRDDASKILLTSIKSKPIKAYSHLLLAPRKKIQTELAPPEFRPIKKGKAFIKIIGEHPEISSDILNILHGVCLLEAERNNKAHQLKMSFFDTPNIGKTIFRCSQSLSNLKKYSKELIELLEILGLPAKYMENESNLLNSLLQYLEKKSVNLDSLRPSFEELRKILGEHKGIIFPIHVKLKKDLQLYVDQMAPQERKKKEGLGEFIILFAHRMKTTGFCPTIEHIRQFNKRLSKLAESQQNIGAILPLTEAIQVMIERVLKKPSEGLELLYELKRFNNYVQKIGILTTAQAEAIDTQLIKGFYAIKSEHQLKLSVPFYRLWTQESGFTKDPKFCSCLLGNTLREAIQLRRTSSQDTDALYEILNEALKSPYYADHLDLIHFIYKDLLTVALKKDSKVDLAKLGNITLEIFLKIRGAHLSQDELSLISTMIEKLLNLSKNAWQARKQHYLGVKLVHLLAENCKMNSMKINSLLNKSISIVLLDKKNEKTNRIFKKTVELLFSTSCVNTVDGAEARTLKEKLLSDLENRSATMRRYVDFVARQNISAAKEFLADFKPHMTSFDWNQANYSICNKLIATNEPDLIKEAYLIWEKLIPDTEILTLHLFLGINLFRAIQLNPKLAHSDLLQNYIAVTTRLLQQYDKDIAQLTLVPKQQLMSHVDEIIGTINTFKFPQSQGILNAFWKASEEAQLIDRVKTPLPPMLIQSALEEGSVPIEVLKVLDQFDPKSDLSATKQALQAIHNLFSSPKYVEGNRNKIWEYCKKLLLANPKSVSDDQKLILLELLFENKFFFDVINLGVNTPIFHTFCHKNPKYWQLLIDALAQYDDLKSMREMMLTIIHIEIIDFPPSLITTLPYASQLNLIRVLTILCERFPKNFSTYCVLFNKAHDELLEVNSKEVRNLVKDFIVVLVTIENSKSVNEACKIFCKKTEYSHLLKTTVLLLRSFAPYEKNLDKIRELNASMLQLLYYLRDQNFIEVGFETDGLESVIRHVLGNVKKHPKEKKEYKDHHIEKSKVLKTSAPTTQPSKSLIFDKQISFKRKIFTIIDRGSDGFLRGGLAFATRITTDLITDAVRTSHPLQYAQWTRSIVGRVVAIKIAYSLYDVLSKKDPSIGKISKAALKAICFTAFTGLSTILIEMGIRSYGHGPNFATSDMDLVDLAALTLPFLAFHKSEYYEENIISYVVSLVIASLTRSIAFKSHTLITRPAIQ